MFQPKGTLNQQSNSKSNPTVKRVTTSNTHNKKLDAALKQSLISEKEAVMVKAEYSKLDDMVKNIVKKGKEISFTVLQENPTFNYSINVDRYVIEVKETIKVLLYNECFLEYNRESIVK